MIVIVIHFTLHGKGATYKKILDSLKDGAKTLSEIRQSIKFAHSGTLSQMMNHLSVAGLVIKLRI